MRDARGLRGSRSSGMRCLAALSSRRLLLVPRRPASAYFILDGLDSIVGFRIVESDDALMVDTRLGGWPLEQV